MCQTSYFTQWYFLFLYGLFLIRLREDKKWISVMVATGNNAYKLNEKYAYLKANDIRCRIKNIAEIGVDVPLARGVQSVSLDVYYKDIEKAEKLLNK